MKSLFKKSTPAVVVGDIQPKSKSHSFGNIFHTQKLHANLPGFMHLPKRGKKVFKAVRLVFIVLATLFILANIALLFYPKDRSMPYMLVGDLDVGRMSRTEIINKLDSKSQAILFSIKTETTTTSITLEELGVSIDSQATADAVLQHRESWYLPFSSFWTAYKSEPIQPIFVIDDEQVDLVASEIIDSLGKEANNASVSFNESGELVLDKANEGYFYSVDDVKVEIVDQLSLDSKLIEISPEIIPPKITTAQAQGLIQEYEQFIDSEFGVEANGEVDFPSRESRAKWLIVESDPAKGMLNIEYDRFAIGGYLASFANRADIPPVNTYVEALDGIEQSRTEGENGRAINREKAVEVIIQALENDSRSTVDLPTFETKPEVIYANNYSPTNAGLATLLDDWLKTQTADYGIIIQELGGDQRTASHQSSKKFVTASTYKMFLAYTILKEVDDGNMKLDDPSGYSNWTVSACIQEMIRVSTNFCAVPLGEKIGWTKATQMVQAAGFTNTTLDNYTSTGALSGHKWSTSRDEADFLIRLNAGQLLSQSSTNFLLNHMKNQLWRGAIPAGLAPGVVSANKVGFLDTYRHDVSIVYAPNGTYVLTVMSQWGTEYSISTLSKEAYNYFN